MNQTVVWTAFSAYIAYKVLWIVLRRHLLRTTTVVNELGFLGGAPPRKKIQGAAVIAGGSMAGYVTARVLTDYFEKIVIIEPDAVITLGGRVPQRAHFHAILSVGTMILRKLFPAFQEEASKSDVYISPRYTRWWVGCSYFGDLKANMPDNVTGSRFSIKSLVRRLSIESCGDKLQVIQGTVIGVEASSDGTAIRAVSLRPVSKSTTTIPCVLFVDCSGPSSIGKKLLPAASDKWGPYNRTSYNPKVSYYSTSVKLSHESQEKVSRLLPKHHQEFGRWDACTIFGVFTSTAETGRDLFGYQRINGDHLLLQYSGWDLDTCPATVAQFADLCRQSAAKVIPEKHRCRDEWFFELPWIAGESTDLLDEPAKWDSCTLTSCYWIDYAFKSVPNNFIAVGDSIMRTYIPPFFSLSRHQSDSIPFMIGVNPIFGQGVSKVLFNATVLNSTLHKALKSAAEHAELPQGFSRSYFKRAFPIDKGIFDSNRMLDYGQDSTIPQPDETLAFGTVFRMYCTLLLNFISHDGKSFEVLEDVLSGYRPFIDLMSPSFIFKSLFWMWWSPPGSA
ncbi:uncharacterized protein EI90DRAFT_2991901 [Cantharellus anzutake]|uniref:uncharacterized protein n=1 Tax=Cantharellus anzutake TaxID=1750568 RepID=UPI001907586F|nr:uncharacterized protein EI90DRAFT_2991901 [Cantharellus anzutake]KAF8337542.1 hypothetical protein EI90DRAFT_2991901 [Cantharellus anzutake]